MPLDVLRRLTIAHGIVAWLDTLLLLMVAVMALRAQGPKHPWFPRLAIMSTVGAILAFASGLLLELHYRVHIRQHLFIASKNLGWLFERKMHLSFGVLAFALVGFCALVLSSRDERFFRSVRAAYGASAGFALASSVISSLVAVAKVFRE